MPGIFEESSQVSARVPLIAAKEGSRASAADLLVSSVLSWLPDGLVILDPDTRVIDVSDGFCAMTGLAREDLRNRHALFPHWPEEENQRLDAAFAACVTDGSAECDVVLPRADGTRFSAIVSVATTRESDGALGGYFVTVKDVTARQRSERIRSAVGRVEALIAADVPIESVFDRVTRELADLSGGGVAVLTRGTGEDAGVAAASEDREPPPESASRVLRAPVRVAGEEWGSLAIFLPEDADSDGMSGVLREMAAMIASALRADRERALVVAREGADELVGLPDGRAFAELTEREFERSRRYGRPVSLVLVDIDGFRQINESHGQAAADGVLREMARRLGSHVRTSDWLGRTGGNEFAWLLPETDESAARDAAARLRRALVEEAFSEVGLLTASLGIASSSSAEGAADLYRQAEVALHWAKVSGRNRAVPYSFHVAEEVFSQHGAERGEAPSLRAMRALAWAVDAKDPHTHRHSTRVADLAVQLATVLGWPVTRAAQLREAGLVHDVGKIAVPDAILFKPGPLTAGEYSLMTAHAEIGATIVADVLSPEQAAWVRSHHERWDGGGYPDGLAAEEIPEEARLLTLADCWDVIISARSYKSGSSAEEALAEVRRCSGTQFWPVAVDALGRLIEAGALGVGDIGDAEGSHGPSGGARIG